MPTPCGQFSYSLMRRSDSLAPGWAVLYCWASFHCGRLDRRGMMDAFSIMLSLALQDGAPAEVIVSKLKDMRFEPFGMTDDPDIPQTSSVMDWGARHIALDFLPAGKRAELGIFSVDEEARQLLDRHPTPITA